MNWRKFLLYGWLPAIGLLSLLLVTCGTAYGGDDPKVNTKTSYSLVLREETVVKALEYWLKNKYGFDFGADCQRDLYLVITNSQAMGEWQIELRCDNYGDVTIE